MTAGGCRRSVAAALLLLPAAAAPAQGPDADWRTFETAHYRIHYARPFEDWARRAAAQIESIHERVTTFVGHAPGQPVEVVIADPAASPNGLAFPFLDRPAIVLWTSPPEAESVIGYYNDWAEILLTHEMAHIVHLVRPRNRSRGILARLSPLPLGPIMLKAPRWVVEGYATLVEGALTGSGRPYGSFRAMVIRRFGLEGKLPGYDGLSSSSGWIGGSAPYLVGSTFLEWLEAREGPGSLQKLWKRLASRRGGNFDRAFRAVFGDSPRDLYDRFRAEMTARALEEEKRLEKAGLVEGELWQKLEGSTASLQVSPDGKRLLARRAPRPERGLLAVWEIEESEEERQAEERRRKREEELLKDPEEVVDKPPAPRPRRPRWTLPAIHRAAPRDPRWMPDSKRILFTMRQPDGDGSLRADLHFWDLDSGAVQRVTRRADIVTADPSPDGRWAMGVENRYGRSRLVRIDLESGATAALAPETAGGDPWRVWIHPRVSPDGARVTALVHTAPRWRLVVLPAAGGQEREVPLPGSPVSPPAWSADGSRIFIATDANGIWNVFSMPADDPAEPLPLTRVTGGAFSPAPHPDGRSLFYLDASARGVSIRRLGLPPRRIEPLQTSGATSPILPPPALEVARPQLAEVGAPSAYSIFPSHVFRPHLADTFGPDGSAFQIGVEGSDVLSRLSWFAVGSVGNAAGPRGGALALAYRGLPVEVRPHVFIALERPGSQKLVKRPELDQERFGGFLALGWRRFFPAGFVRLDGGAGASRVEARETGEELDRNLASFAAEASLDRTRGRRGFGGDLSLKGSIGRTAGGSWSQARAEAGVSLIHEVGRLRVSGSLGDTGGDPTRFDLFAIGGAPSEILPPGLDRNRIDSPALPAAVQLGERVEILRAELYPRASPLRIYAERLRAWSDGGKPDAVRVLGAELRIRESSVSLNAPGSFDLYLGVAKIRSDSPRFDSTRGYGGVIFRP